MNNTDPQLEKMLEKAAQSFPYPPTPDFTARVLSQRRQPRRLMNTRGLQIAAALLTGLAILFTAVPEIRAAVLTFLRIGAVTITQDAPPYSLTLTPTLSDMLDFPGETTLSAAQAGFNAPIALPAFPADLGEPSRVFAFSQMVVLIWLDEQQQVRLELHVIPSSLQATKYYPYEPVETEVNGARARWMSEVHTYEFFGGETPLERTITGNVLLWERENITYRLITDESLEGALRIADSVR